jgi:hypothetical protein
MEFCESNALKTIAGAVVPAPLSPAYMGKALRATADRGSPPNRRHKGVQVFRRFKHALKKRGASSFPAAMSGERVFKQRTDVESLDRTERRKRRDKRCRFLPALAAPRASK